jgi:hypothetical protein
MDQTIKKRVTREGAEAIVTALKGTPEYIPGPVVMPTLNAYVTIIVEDLPKLGPE